MNAPCTVEIRRTETGYFLSIVGRGTLHASRTVKEFICNAVEDGAEVTLDLSACEYLDSTFLGCLVIVQQRGSRADGSFAVHANQLVRHKLLHKAGLQHVLTFVDDCPEGIGDPVTLQISDVEQREFCQHLLETHQRLAELGGPTAPKFRAIADQLSKELGNLS